MNIIARLTLAALIIIAALFVGFAALGFYRKHETTKTNSTLEKINNRKITLDDAMGKNLPPLPDEELNNSTVSGFDINDNAIRDDVELEIFKRYPDSAKIRAAMLQYAQALQLQLTEVFNSETYIVALTKEENASICIIQNFENSELKNLTKDLVINTQTRKEKQENDVEHYFTTYTLRFGPRCDLDFDMLLD